MTTTPHGIVLRHDKTRFTFITREHLNQKVTSCQPKHQGDCIMSDPAICHSEPTFRATYAPGPADVTNRLKAAWRGRQSSKDMGVLGTARYTF